MKKRQLGTARSPNGFNIFNDKIQSITRPALALVSEDEGEMMLRQARFFYENISSKEKKMHIFKHKQDGSNDHCQLDNFARAHQVTYDWLDTIFKQL